MQGIVPHLWFDDQAKEAAEFYTAVFPNSRVTNVTTIHNPPPWNSDADIVSFELVGQPFMAISAGPMFTFNPSVSFRVKCSTLDEVDTLWQILSAGGTVLMELGAYPWSERYGWTQDRYGLSWQVILVGDQDGNAQKITPVLMFVGDVCGKAEEAVNAYVAMFPNSEVKGIVRHGKGEEPDREGTVTYADFTLAGQAFGAMDGAQDHKFAFNEAISFIVSCDTQEEVDDYWDKLSAVPEAEQCGWIKDKYGLSWQIVPAALDRMMEDKDEARLARVTEAVLGMKKLDLAALQRAYDGR